jgi:formylglycine-generating enzyme required for sulfatase activity
LSREYFIYDGDRQRQLSALELPIRIGGKKYGGIVIPGVADDRLFAVIALSDGHAYIQPAKSAPVIFHNDERLFDSAWLKSGDRVQIVDSVISWEIQGDRVLISVQPCQMDDHQLRPPKQAPIATKGDSLPVSDNAPVGNDKKPVRRSVVVLVSVLALVAIYILMATSVTIRAEPDTAVVSLKGFPPVISVGNSYLAFPGGYHLSISAPGYVPKLTELDINMGAALNLAYVLAELPGVIRIKTEQPAVLKLIVDGIETATNANGGYEIARGTHTLQVQSKRYLPLQLDIEVDGYGDEQEIELVLEPAWAVVAIASSPPGAEVLVDDEVVGLTPVVAEILQGQHEIRLQKPGFKQLTAFQSFAAGEAFSMDEFQLQPVDGKLSLSSHPAGASILIGGKFLGTTPKTLELAAETDLELQLSKAGYTTARQVFRLAPDEERHIDIRLPVEYGSIFLQVQPAGAVLTINGKKADRGSGRLRLQTRQNILELSKSGYVSQRLTVTPQAGVSRTISISLITRQQQQVQEKQAATPNLLTAVDGQTLGLIEVDSEFHMGASRRDAGRRANESRRLVKLQRPFYLAHKEVTNAQFRRFKPAHDSGSSDSAALNGEDQPVVNVSWDDAARYCNWLSKQQALPLAYREEDGHMQAVSPMTSGYRLPTEAEWAWVARRRGFETEQRYPWHGSFPPVNKNGNYADARIADTLVDVVPGYDDGYRGTAPVGSFPAWPDNFFDLGGNAAEWMHDIYALYPGESNRLVIDPMGPADGKHHVVRGAGWRSGNIAELRLSYRDYSNKLRYDLGFRIARYAE